MAGSDSTTGLAASIGGASRMIAPPIAGILYAKGRRLEFTGLAWFGSGIIAIFGILQIFTIPRNKDDSTRVRPLARCLSHGQDAEIPREVVDIVIADDYADTER